MFIAPEVKGDLQLEQAEFQSVVSGEDVSFAVKHEKAKSFEWKTLGVLGGNDAIFLHFLFDFLIWPGLYPLS